MNAAIITATVFADVAATAACIFAMVIMIWLAVSEFQDRGRPKDVAIGIVGAVAIGWAACRVGWQMARSIGWIA